ncbi:MAG: LamG domain-containing protein [Phycisphaerales bacterium]
MFRAHSYMTVVVLGLCSASITEAGAMGIWTFDEGMGVEVGDSSGNDNRGRLIGEPAWVEGWLGTALAFDGIDDYVEVPHHASLVPSGGEVTAMAWIYAERHGGPNGVPWQGIVAKDDSPRQYSLYTQDNGTLHFSTGPYFSHVCTNSTSTVPLREWVHVAAMVKDMRHAYFINGKPSGVSGTDAVLLPGSKSTVRIGNTQEPERTFWGMIDEVRLYDRALSQEEIEDLMTPHSLLAWSPRPKQGSYASLRNLKALLWVSGETAATHDVYLGTDEEAVRAADVASPLYWGRRDASNFSVEGLVEAGLRYFWRIDEVEADGATIHRGVVWSFTVTGYSMIDDFEGYSDEQGSRIEETWIDGSTNGTASEVSRWIQPSGTAGRNSRNKQTLILAYDNARSPYYSEAERQFVAQQDWTAGLADTLSLSVKGDVVSFAETAPGVYTMSASGNDIWSNKDNCRFAFKRLDGNGSMSVRVDSIVMTDVWAKAGVMIRESLDPGSANAFMLVTPTGRRDFQNRPDNGSGLCFAAHSSVGTISLPYWIKLERRGDQFTAYHSPDGIRWIRQPDDEEIVSYQSSNPQTISMPNSAYIGLALCSHNGGAATTAVFGDVKTMGYVGSKWQVEEIGFDHPGNMPDDLYVVVEDGDGKVATVTHPDPWAVNAPAWTEWRIPFSDLAGVDLTRVQGLRIGVGGRESSTPPGDGIVCIDDILVWKP